MRCIARGLHTLRQSEAIEGCIPKYQNSPKHPPFGLYPELISGTSFIAPKDKNFYTWTYRLRPSVRELSKFKRIQLPRFITHKDSGFELLPTPYRFSEVNKSDLDFLDSLTTLATNGNADLQDGAATSVFRFTKSMETRIFQNLDADMLLLPYRGAFRVKTEFGELDVGKHEFCLVQRGMKFQIFNLMDSECAGYCLENFGDPFQLPEFGPIGISTGLAQPRHFISPEAKFSDEKKDFQLITRFQDSFVESFLDYSPFDVVGFFGNFMPYKYDLELFCPINTVAFDHTAPSIGTLLQSPGRRPGFSNIDFVVFPPHFRVQQNTFRPPWFHQNCMSELMGILSGVYDAKQTGFYPGCISLHNQFIPHGPDYETLILGSKTPDDTERIESMAFMFESARVWHPTKLAKQLVNDNYVECWKNLETRFFEDTRKQKKPM